MTDFFRFGALADDVITGAIQLWGKITASGNVTHLRKNFTAVGYQVTAGKVLYLVRIVATPSLGGALSHVKVGYADNDVGLDTVTARTSPVMAWGLDDTQEQGFTFAAPTLGEHHFLEGDHGLLWPIAAASKFPFARAVGSSPTLLSLTAWCIEA